MNGLWVHARSISAAVANYVDPLFYRTGMTHTEVSLRGSGTFLKVSGRYFVVATQHQVKDYDVQNIAVLGVSFNQYTTSNAYYDMRPSKGQEEECQHDLCAFEFTKPVLSRNISSSRFFDLTPSYTISQGDKIIGGNVYGYAFQDQNFDYDETGIADYRLMHIGLKKREVSCQYSGEYFDNSVARWKRGSSHTFDPNGFSGSPVFAIVDTGHGYYCKFAGIVSMGGGAFLHSIKGEKVARFLRQIVARS